MAQILCEDVTRGLRASERLAVFKDYQGRTHYMRVEQDFLSLVGDKWYLPVGVVFVDREHDAFLIELSHEAETGARRLWVKKAQFKEDQ